MYIYSVILHWVYILDIKSCLFLVNCLWEFVCELSWGSHLLVSISLFILRVRNKWPFPKDSGSLSSPSLHTLVIWLFSMAWFEWIRAHSFSFDLFVPLMVFHSHCLHCSLFILICIPCSIFSTHHSYTSHQQFDILHFFSFIIDIFILNSFSSSSIYSYWMSSDPWFMRLSAHIAFYTWGYEVLLLGIWV